MRFQLTPSRSATGFNAGFMASLAVHAIVVVFAVRSTAVSAAHIMDEIAQRLAYLPPPNRQPNVIAQAEQLSYVDIGGGPMLAGIPKPDGSERLASGPLPENKPGGEQGTETISERASTPIPSQDSVYTVVEVEERAARAEGSAAPAYPAELLKKGTEGMVVARFIVDTLGRIDPASIKIMFSSNEEFTRSVRTAMPRMTFSPATIGGHPVRQAAEQNFNFRLQPGVATAKPNDAQ